MTSLEGWSSTIELRPRRRSRLPRGRRVIGDEGREARQSLTNGAGPSTEPFALRRGRILGKSRQSVSQPASRSASPPVGQRQVGPVNGIQVSVSGRRDSNPRPPAPKAGTLTKLRYAPLPSRAAPRW